MLLKTSEREGDGICLLVVLGQPVSGAGDQVEQLGHGVEEVDHLWDEEEEEGFGKVS